MNTLESLVELINTYKDECRSQKQEIAYYELQMKEFDQLKSDYEELKVENEVLQMKYDSLLHCQPRVEGTTLIFS